MSPPIRQAVRAQPEGHAAPRPCTGPCCQASPKSWPRAGCHLINTSQMRPQRTWAATGVLIHPDWPPRDNRQVCLDLSPARQGVETVVCAKTLEDSLAPSGDHSPEKKTDRRHYHTSGALYQSGTLVILQGTDISSPFSARNDSLHKSKLKLRLLVGRHTFSPDLAQMSLTTV